MPERCLSSLMRQRRSVVVQRPPDEVFAFVADPTNLPRWVEAIEEAQPVGPADEPGVGTRFVQHVQAPEGSERFEGRIVEHDPPRAVGFRFPGETGEIDLSFHLEETRAGTRVTETLQVPLDGWSTKLLAPMLWFSNRSRIRDHLAGLAEALEAQSVDRA